MLPELSKMASSKRVQTPKLAKQYSNNMHPNFQDLHEHFESHRLSKAINTAE